MGRRGVMESRFTRGTFVPAIHVKVLPATDFKGARLKATTEGGSVTKPMRYSYDIPQDQVLEIVHDLMEKLDLRGPFVGGWNGEDFVFVKDIGPKVDR